MSVVPILDFFDIPINFTYKKEDKYSHKLGVFIFVTYLIVFIIYLIFSFIPFVKRDIYSVEYYPSNMDKTDKLNFKNSKNYFAYRLEYKNNDNSNLTCDELLEIKISHIHSEVQDRKRHKKYSKIKTYNCSYDNSKKIYVKEQKKSDYICIEHESNLFVQNTYNNEFFEYYELNVSLKDSENDNFTRINNFLLNNDCKLEFFYLDYTLNSTNYKKPTSPYLNSVFLQLNPVEIIDMNVYFMKQILEEHKNLILSESHKKLENTIFSRIEQYTYYQGDNRIETKAKTNNKDYKTYAKLFIRADIKEVKVKRKYQTLAEFWPDNTSLFFDLFTLLNFLIGNFYRYFSYKSLSKEIIYFTNEDLKNKKFKYLPKDNNIKNIIDNFDKVGDIEISKDKTNKLNINIKNYENQNPNNLNEQNNLKESETSLKTNKLKDIIDNSINNENFRENKNQNEETFENFIATIFSPIIPCSRRNIKKRKIISKASDIINEKLDIILYIRNTILLDKMKKIYFDGENEDIFKFLNIPILSSNGIKDEDEDKDEDKNIYAEKKEKMDEKIISMIRSDKGII